MKELEEKIQNMIDEILNDSELFWNSENRVQTLEFLKNNSDFWNEQKREQYYTVFEDDQKELKIVIIG